MKHTMKRLLGLVLALSLILTGVALPGVTVAKAVEEDTTEYILNEKFDSYEVDDEPSEWLTSTGTRKIVEENGNKVLSFAPGSKTSTFAYKLGNKYSDITLSYNIKMTGSTGEYLLTLSASGGSVSDHIVRLNSRANGGAFYYNSNNDANTNYNVQLANSGEKVTFAINQWHSVKIRYSYDETNTTQTVAVYIDGQLTDVGVYLTSATTVSVIGMQMYKGTSNTILLDNICVSVEDHDEILPQYTSLSFAQNTYSVGTGDTVQTAVTAAPSNAYVKDTWTYSSDNESIATVDPETGVVTGVAVGSASITATCVNNPSITATTNVNVYYLKNLDDGPFVSTATSEGWYVQNATFEQVTLEDGNKVLKLTPNSTGTTTNDNTFLHYYLGGSSFDALTLSYDVLISEHSADYLLSVSNAHTGKYTYHKVCMRPGTRKWEDSTGTEQVMKYEDDTNVTFEAATWYHIEIVYDASGNTRVYIDGKLTNIKNAKAENSDATAIKAVGMHMARGNTGRYAYLDNIRVSTQEREFFINQSATLGDSIGMNFTGEVESSSGISQMQVTVGETKNNFAVKEDNSFEFSVPMAAAQMKETISVQPVDADGNAVGKASEYSVQAYLEALKALYPDNVKLTTLVDQTLNYGAMAENYFCEATNESGDLTMLDVPVFGDVTDVAGTLDGITAKSVSLLFKNEIAIRYYFVVTDDISNYTFKVGDAVLTPVLSGSRYYVDYTGINPQQYGTSVVLTVSKTGVEETLTVTYSPLSYIIRMSAKTTTSEKMKALLHAMYNYYIAAKDYVTDSTVKTIYQQRQEIAEGLAAAMTTEVTSSIDYYPAYQSSTDGYEHIQAITYDGPVYNGSKTKVFAYLGYPEGATEANPVPAVVLVHGGGGCPMMDWVKLWNDRGYAAIAMSYVGEFPQEQGVVVYRESVSDNPNSLPDTFARAWTTDFQEDGYVLAPARSYVTSYAEVEKQWAYHALSQIIYAHNILRESNLVDSDKIGISGISWGGTLTTQVIGYDNRFAFAIPVYGHAYLNDDMHSFSKFGDEYVSNLWGAEKNLDNAKMPIYWLATNIDGNFTINEYVNSYKHTEGLNDKNVLSMINGLGHSHNVVFDLDYYFPFADWAISDDNSGYVTFDTQPTGRDVNVTVNIPEGATNITAEVIYINAPMAYEKSESNSNYYLTEKWNVDANCLTVGELENSKATITGTVPDTARGYYIQVKFDLATGDNTVSAQSSSVYVALDALN